VALLRAKLVPEMEAADLMARLRMAVRRAGAVRRRVDDILGWRDAKVNKVRESQLAV